MPFPVSRSFTVSLHERWSEEKVLGTIQERLPILGASDLRQAPGLLAFKVPWTTSYGPLFIVSSGTFTVGADFSEGLARGLRCYLSFRRAAVVVAVLCYGWLGLGVSLLEGGPIGGSVAGTLLFCTVGYCWLLGIWYIIVPEWLAKRLQLSRFTLPP
jgi:hypothetical protein